MRSANVRYARLQILLTSKACACSHGNRRLTRFQTAPSDARVTQEHSAGCDDHADSVPEAAPRLPGRRMCGTLFGTRPRALGEQPGDHQQVAAKQTSAASASGRTETAATVRSRDGY